MTFSGASGSDPAAGSMSQGGGGRRPPAGSWRAGTFGLALLALAACSLLPAGRAGQNDAANVQTVVFTTGEALRLQGVLELPAGPGPAAAVVLMHDCQEPSSGAIRGWQTALVTWGYATLEVDGFAPRTVANACEKAGALWPAERVPDAYAALVALARHPRIAADRIALMGWGHGGTAALQSASARLAEKYARPAGPRFRAFVAFYPTCRLLVPDAGPMINVSPLAAPVRILVGELDDWAPAQPCLTLLARLGQAGQDAELTVFGGARHRFDSIGQPDEQLSAVDNYGGETHRKGARIGWSPDATRQARDTVREQLEHLLATPAPR